jgi:hypothetical protein
MGTTAHDKALRKVSLVSHLCDRLGLDPEDASSLIDDYPDNLAIQGADNEAMLGALANAALVQNTRVRSVIRHAAKRAANPDTSEAISPHTRAKAAEPSKLMYASLTTYVEWLNPTGR